MLIGYARVSTDEQNLDLQRDALQKAGCTRIFTDHISGTKARRPGLEEALSHLRSGDTLVVWRLDRLGRSLRHLIDTVNDLQEQGVNFKSLTEALDTTTSDRKLVFHIFLHYESTLRYPFKGGRSGRILHTLSGCQSLTTYAPARCRASP